MERIFWVVCPACEGRFYCTYALRHAGVRLECPHCPTTFLPDEARELDERGQAEQAAQPTS
jgi:hypothetical protein